MSPLALVSAWIPVVLWAGLIFYISSIPKLDSGLGVWDFVLRKIAHMVEYAVLTAFLIRALKRTWSALTMFGILWISGFFSILYAVSDEVHQAYVPGRGPSFKDVVIDACGVALYLVLYREYSRRCELMEKS